MKNYYTKQLEKLNGRVKVKFVSDNGETNYLELTKECCQSISETITKLNKDKKIIVE